MEMEMEIEIEIEIQNDIKGTSIEISVADGDEWELIDERGKIMHMLRRDSNVFILEAIIAFFNEMGFSSGEHSTIPRAFF